MSAGTANEMLTYLSIASASYNGDKSYDEMWIDQDGECTDIYRGQQLKTDIDAAGGQSGGP